MRKFFLAAAAATALMSGAAYANIAHGVEGGQPPVSVLELGNGSAGLQGNGGIAAQQQNTQEQQNLQGNQSGVGSEENGGAPQQ
jgi:hypothetical protein